MCDTLVNNRSRMLPDLCVASEIIWTCPKSPEKKSRKLLCNSHEVEPSGHATSLKLKSPTRICLLSFCFLANISKCFLISLKLSKPNVPTR